MIEAILIGFLKDKKMIISILIGPSLKSHLCQTLNIISGPFSENMNMKTRKKFFHSRLVVVLSHLLSNKCVYSFEIITATETSDPDQKVINMHTSRHNQV